MDRRKAGGLPDNAALPLTMWAFALGDSFIAVLPVGILALHIGMSVGIPKVDCIGRQ